MEVVESLKKSRLKKTPEELELDRLLRKEKRKKASLDRFKAAYSNLVDEDMGKLHNVFVNFIQEAGLPLPQTLLVLQMLIRETMDQAVAKYLGRE